MGWRWSLLICKAIAESATRVGIAQALSIPPDDVRIVYGRAPFARFSAGELACPSYVDSSNATGSPRSL
eukprot:9487122-Pyramimonas_sp.AAC.2